MVLYINSCVRSNSRTDRIAKAVLDKRGEAYEELYLPEEDLKPLSREAYEKRTALVEKGDYSDPMFRYAKQFAAADTIVISAPYWDGSFPALLKTYLENIYVIGLVSEYSPEGMPVGLCKAKELIYVTTAGGQFDPTFSYNYVKALCERCFGIQNVKLVKAEMLDIVGNDAEQIVRDTIRRL